jgi:cytochrome c2
MTAAAPHRPDRLRRSLRGDLRGRLHRGLHGGMAAHALAWALCGAWLAGCDRGGGPADAQDAAGAAAARGKAALTQYACSACHSIPGITGSQPQVGPPLAGMATRRLIAGRLPNTPDNMQAWIREPQRFDPHSAMPALGVTAAHARDMAAYLATLR